jgi:Ca2+-binding RTX toxin-like protein
MMANGYFYGQMNFNNFAFSGFGFQQDNDVNSSLFFPWVSGPTGFLVNLVFDYEDRLTANAIPNQSDQPAFFGPGITMTAGAVTGGTITGMAMGTAAGSGLLLGVSIAAALLEPARNTASNADDVAWLRQALSGNDNLRHDWNSSTSDVVFGGAGQDQIYSYGGNDSLNGDAGQDTVVGGGGADTLLGSGGLDSVLGGNGADFLYGGTGADSLFGGLGDDAITGGAQIDALTGGNGNDRFIFNLLAHGGDVIADFSNMTGNNDRFRISAAGFGGGLTAGVLATNQFQTRVDNVAQDNDDRFIFRTTDRTLWFDANGNGAGGLTMLADLQAGAVVTAADILIW